MKNRIQLEHELDNIKGKLQDCLEEYYEFICSIISFSHCKQDYIKSFTEEFWNKIISICYSVGGKLNHTEEYTTSKLDCELIGIYSYFGQYDKAYDVMVIMAKNNGHWIKMDDKVLEWAKSNYVLHGLENAIERQFVNYTIDYDSRATYEEALKKVKKIRGV